MGPDGQRTCYTAEGTLQPMSDTGLCWVNVSFPDLEPFRDIHDSTLSKARSTLWPQGHDCAWTDVLEPPWSFRDPPKWSTHTSSGGLPILEQVKLTNFFPSQLSPMHESRYRWEVGIQRTTEDSKIQPQAPLEHLQTAPILVTFTCLWFLQPFLTGQRTMMSHHSVSLGGWCWAPASSRCALRGGQAGVTLVLVSSVTLKSLWWPCHLLHYHHSKPCFFGSP